MKLMKLGLAGLLGAISTTACDCEETTKLQAECEVGNLQANINYIDTCFSDYQSLDLYKEGKHVAHLPFARLKSQKLKCDNGEVFKDGTAMSVHLADELNNTIEVGSGNVEARCKIGNLTAFVVGGWAWIAKEGKGRDVYLYNKEGEAVAALKGYRAYSLGANNFWLKCNDGRTLKFEQGIVFYELPKLVEIK